MQKYKVIGADRQTGEYCEVIVEAISKTDAGKRSALMVQMIELVEEPQAIPNRHAPAAAPTSSSVPMNRPKVWEASEIVGIVLVVMGWLGIGLAMLLIIAGISRYNDVATAAGWAGEESSVTFGAAIGSALSTLFAGGVLLGLGTIIRVLRLMPRAQMRLE